MGIRVRLNFGYLAAFFFWLFPLLSTAQQNVAPVYNFEVKNRPLGEALDKLSVLTSVNFSYNSDDASFQQKINYKASAKPLQVILSDILTASGHNFKQIGRQFVIYNAAVAKENNVQPEPLPIKESTFPLKDTLVLQKEVPVLVYDTIYLKDTLIKTETLVIRDTVIQEKIVYRTNRKPGLRNFPKDFFQFDPNRNDGPFLVFSYGQHYGGFLKSDVQDTDKLAELTDETESQGFRNFSVGSELGYNYQKWAVNFGIQYKGFSSRFRYNQVISSGGYYQRDTVSWYYNVAGNDTTWIAVTDSSYLPFEKSEINYNQLNRVGFLDFNLGLYYNYFAFANTRLYLKGGIGYSVMIHKDGILIQDKPGYPGTDYRNVNLRKNLMNYQLGTGICYMAGNKFDLYAELGYQGYSAGILQDYPLDKRLYSIGLKLGLIFFL